MTSSIGDDERFYPDRMLLSCRRRGADRGFRVRYIEFSRLPGYAGQPTTIGVLLTVRENGAPSC